MSIESVMLTNLLILRRPHLLLLTVYTALGEGDGNPLQYSCLENPLDRGTWQAEAEAPILWPPDAKS